MALDLIMSTSRAVMLKKRKMRGRDNILRQGLQGVVTRISEDKLERVKKSVEDLALRSMLVKRGVPLQTVDDIAPDPFGSAEETISLEDDLLDIANYCYIAVALMRGVW